MRITLSAFRGENRALHPKLLPDGVGAVSLNQWPQRGDLRPLKQPVQVASVPGGRGSIYRFGRDVASDSAYWFSWPGVAHAVRGMTADNALERTYITGGGAAPKVADNVASVASAPYPTAVRELGVPAPAAAMTAAVTADGPADATQEVRYYTCTYITDRGEESAPAPVSAPLTCRPGATVALQGIAAAPSGSYGIRATRVYRTATGVAGDSTFVFLREIASTATSTVDDARAVQEVMPTTGWLPPPANLSWLTPLWNGMMAGISGGAVRFCEPYAPYAWPAAYEALTPDATPVALAVFGQQLLVLTTGQPFVVSGASSDSMDAAPTQFVESCVAPRSAVGFGHGVIWACPDGLAYYGSGGARLLTDGLMTREDWQAINPAGIVAASYEGSYLAFYTDGAGVRRGFFIDPARPQGIYFLERGYDALWFDDLQDQLYVLDGTAVKKWNAGAAMTARFRSKVYRTPAPVNFSVAELIADAFPVTVRFYADGALRHQAVVSRQGEFRLPGGFLATDWQFEVETAVAVQGLAVAESVEELAAL